MAKVTGNATKDFMSLVKGTQAASSAGKPGEITPREMEMLKRKLKEMGPTDQSKACAALRNQYPELHGSVTGEAI